MIATIDDIVIHPGDIATITLNGPHGVQVAYAEAGLMFDSLEWLDCLHGAWQGASFDVHLAGDMLMSIDLAGDDDD